MSAVTHVTRFALSVIESKQLMVLERDVLGAGWLIWLHWRLSGTEPAVEAARTEPYWRGCSMRATVRPLGNLRRSNAANIIIVYVISNSLTQTRHWTWNPNQPLSSLAWVSQSVAQTPEIGNIGVIPRLPHGTWCVIFVPHYLRMEEPGGSSQTDTSSLFFNYCTYSMQTK